MSAAQRWKIALLLGVKLFLSAPALGSTLLLVKGPNSPAYREALSGFQQTYPGAVVIDNNRRELTRQLQSNPPSMIVAIGREAAETARQQARDIPLVFLMVLNPVSSGLTGTNVAGISMQLPGDAQLSRFRELLPNKNSIAVLHNPSWSGSIVQEAEGTAKQLEMHLEDVPVSSPDEVRSRFNFIKPIVEVVWVIPDEFTTPARVWEFLRDQADRSKLPLVFTNAEQAVAGGALASLVPDYRDMGRQCGELVREIFSGKTTVGTAQIRPPQTMRWVVNTRTARKVGVAIPRAILDSAKTYP